MNVPRRFRFPVTIKTLPWVEMTEYEKWKANNKDRMALWASLQDNHGVKRDPVGGSFQNLTLQTWKHFRLPPAYEKSQRDASEHIEKKDQRKKDIKALMNGEPVYHGGEIGEDDMPKRDKMLSRYMQSSAEPASVGDWPSSQERDEFVVAQHSLNEALHLDIAPHTCSSCEKLCIDIRELVSDSWMRLKWWAFENGPDISIVSPTGMTVYEAILSATNGCAFWAMLMEGNDYDGKYFSNHLAQGLIPDHDQVDEELGELYSDDDNNIMLSYIASREDEPSIQFKLGRGPGQPTYLHVWVPSGDRLQPFLPNTLPPNLVPNSELSFYHARRWIDECIENHEDCNIRDSEDNSFIPKRVLSVRKGDTCPLIQLISQPSAAHYAALSYCWGGDQPAKTIKDNVAAYSAGIAFDSLPRAIQDAVLVTISIGIPYLWVDALCIVQDDDDDKADQIVQMHRIYRCSYATIAASVSSGSTEGFLYNRRQLRPLRVRGRLDDNVFADLILSPEILAQDGISYEADLPLFQRAWTFQETHLPRRILSYGHQGLIYRCLSSTHIEGVSKIDDINIYTAIDPGNTRYNALSHPYSWQAIMTAYTQRQLTVASDKLLGIAAMAEEYSKQKGTTEYYAGLWKEDFASQLLWLTDREEDSLAPRPKQYIASSWSWASVTRPVWMHDDLMESAGMPNGPLEEPSTMLDHFCVLLEANMTLVDPKNPFGMVSAGYVKVSAKTKKIMVHITQRSPSLKMVGRDTSMTADQCLLQWPRSGGYDARLNFDIDYPEEVIDGTIYTAVEICGVASAGEDEDSEGEENELFAGRSYGLLLERVGSDTYRRIGVITLARQDVWGWMFDVPESQVITII
ncbi:hypothetical protein SCUP234_13258 [Seiridium cupressi]